MTFRIDQADAIAYMRQMPDNSVDLVFGSPPYEKARLYLENGEDVGIARNTDEWVAWMVEVYREASRVCKGMVAFVVEGQTKNYKYSCGPMLLAADLHRAGFNLRKPPIFRRVGIPGSGGPDWLRNDFEFIICVTPKGKLSWSDNTACGHPPKWAPGGEMSHRQSDGARVNEDDPWGKRGRGNNLGGRESDGTVKVGTLKKAKNAFGVATDRPVGTRPKGDKGKVSESETYRAKPARLRTKGGSPKDSCRGRRVPRGTSVNGELLTEDAYLPPVLANPGNVIQKMYTADEVAALLAEQADIITCLVGGGVMGHPLAHLNEAPFPEPLSDFFVKSFCRPGGTVLDPFVGGGTTMASAVKHGRNGIGCDIRASQVELARRRVAETQPVFDFEQEEG